jgi:hypothetical protein
MTPPELLPPRLLEVLLPPLLPRLPELLRLLPPRLFLAIALLLEK